MSLLFSLLLTLARSLSLSRCASCYTSKCLYVQFQGPPDICICLLYVVTCYMSESHTPVKWWWDLGHSSVHVRGVGSGGRDVDAWRANGCTPRVGGSKYRWSWSIAPSPPAAKPRRGLIRGSGIGFRQACFGLSDWTTLIVYKWLLKLIHSLSKKVTSNQGLSFEK